eukprot:6212834-Pleurochrysis_carterae.AAC.2
MHAQFGVRANDFIPTVYKLRKEDLRLRNEERAVASETGMGATMSLTGSICACIRRAQQQKIISASGKPEVGVELEAYVLYILVAGDGFRFGKRKAVRLGVALVSTAGLNQSPHDWSDFCLYQGGESWLMIKCVLEPIENEIHAINKNGFVVCPQTGEELHVRLLLGGDMPWLLAILGKRNMNFFAGFSPYCFCTMDMQMDFDMPLEGHMCITAAIAAMRCHCSPGEAYYGDSHSDFYCDAAGCTFGELGTNLVTNESREQLREELAQLREDGQLSKASGIEDTFSKIHGGFDFDKPCLFKFHSVAPDPLHAYLNVLTFIVHDFVVIKDTDPEDLRDIKHNACDLINVLCDEYRIGIQFKHEKAAEMPNINGNAWKMMVAGGFFSGVIDIMSVLWRMDSALFDDTQAQQQASPTDKRSPFKPPVDQASRPTNRRRVSKAVLHMQSLLDASAAASAQQSVADAAVDGTSTPAQPPPPPSAGQAMPPPPVSNVPLQPPPSLTGAAAEKQVQEQLEELQRTQAANSVECRAIDMLFSLLDHWSYITDKSIITDTTDEERSRRKLA